MRDIHDSPPADWTDDRKREYFEWASCVVDGMRGTNAALERAFDEACRCGVDSLQRADVAVKA